MGLPDIFLNFFVEYNIFCLTSSHGQNFGISIHLSEKTRNVPPRTCLSTSFYSKNRGTSYVCTGFIWTWASIFTGEELIEAADRTSESWSSSLKRLLDARWRRRMANTFFSRSFPAPRNRRTHVENSSLWPLSRSFSNVASTPSPTSEIYTSDSFLTI